MPRDTVWINNTGGYLIAETDTINPNTLALFFNTLDTTFNLENVRYSFNPKNSKFADSILQQISMRNNTALENASITEKSQREDKVFGFFASLILLAAILVGIYAYRRAEKYKENPFDEDERDWVEIGSSSRNNFGQSSNEDSIIFPKPAPKPLKEYLTYNGWDLKFDETQVINVLKKRFAYFNTLGMAEQKRFLVRHKKFMRSKIFKIHTYNGFKEMPILISATAIQLSFGLDEFMLPFYQYIHIFPQEFLGMHPTMRFLEGNVSGNSINISWKHYLEGNENPHNGQNLGLHEMAHAYYAQNFTFDGEKDSCLINGFSSYNICGNKIFEAEKIQSGNLFSDYALKNFQEFWAESVEIFFERPSEMKEQYLNLYESISTLLNQKRV
jgi:Mlc titration factor MtfA (ptsG expression regulator)